MRASTRAGAGGTAREIHVPSEAAMRTRDVAQAKPLQRVDPAAFGRRVLAGLERARQCAAELVQARTEALAAQILTLAAVDIARGHRAWGRAGRIQRKMGSVMSERQIKRYLDALSEKSELVVHNSRQTTGGPGHAK